MKLILGGPGTGKTTELLNRVEDELGRGVPPDRIALLTFTRKAAEEARDRAAVKFSLDPKALPYFRTVHSLSFQQLGLLPEEVMRTSDYSELGKSLGLRFDSLDGDFGLPTGHARGTKIAFIEQLARIQNVSVDEVCEAADIWEVRRYRDALAAYKTARGIIDFTDMINEFCASDVMPALDVLFVDEAQDLTPLHWRAIRKLIKVSKRVYIAGDDDQAIYNWAGAAVDEFLGLEAERTVLPVSHRLPRTVFSLVNHIASQIRVRYPKDWRPRDAEGSIRRYARMDDVMITDGTWLMLSRHNYMLDPFVTMLRRLGLPFIYQGKSSVHTPTVRAVIAWEKLRRGEELGSTQVKQIYAKLKPKLLETERPPLRLDDREKYNADRLMADWGLRATPDWMTAINMTDAEREYLRALRRHGESLTNSPRIKVSSIHAAKGGEADNVVMMPDMSFTAHRGLIRNRDSECRVFFVGASRAMHNLHLLYPSGARYFPHLRA